MKHARMGLNIDVGIQVKDNRKRSQCPYAFPKPSLNSIICVALIEKSLTSSVSVKVAGPLFFFLPFCNKGQEYFYIKPVLLNISHSGVSLPVLSWF